MCVSSLGVELWVSKDWYGKVIQQFSEKFLETRTSNKSTIKRIIDGFCNHYTIGSWKCSGHSRDIMPEVTERVHTHFQANSCISLFCAAHQLKITTSARCIVEWNSQLCPYPVFFVDVQDQNSLRSFQNPKFRQHGDCDKWAKNETCVTMVGLSVLSFHVLYCLTVIFLFFFFAKFLHFWIWKYSENIYLSENMQKYRTYLKICQKRLCKIDIFRIGKSWNVKI